MRVGVDQSFNFGPDVPFRAHSVFTDREEQLRRLHERFIAHGTQAWPVSELLNFQRAASNVVSVAGMVGREVAACAARCGSVCAGQARGSAGASGVRRDGLRGSVELGLRDGVITGTCRVGFACTVLTRVRCGAGCVLGAEASG